jgi:aspartyl-tRNA(Asn)/glutamyl-tRNA(Gln) amidotransferase subunit A
VDARAADARQRAGRSRGPLDGVPVFAKSIYDMVGLPTTASSADWARRFPERVQRDALEIARLRGAGAIVLGKTAADDFAYRGNGTSSHTGQVLNPHDPTRTRTPGARAPAPPSSSPRGWRSRRSAPTTAAPTASRRSSRAWSG